MEFGLKGTSRVCRGRHVEAGIVEFGLNYMASDGYLLHDVISGGSRCVHGDAEVPISIIDNCSVLRWSVGPHPVDAIISEVRRR